MYFLCAAAAACGRVCSDCLWDSEQDFKESGDAQQGKSHLGHCKRGITCRLCLRVKAALLLHTDGKEDLISVPPSLQLLCDPGDHT